MNQYKLFLNLLVLLLIASLSVAADKKHSKEGELRAAIAAFGQAFVAADVHVLKTYLTDDYIHVNGSSGNVLNQQQWLAWLETRQTKIAAGSLVIVEYLVKDLVIKINADSAIVIGVIESNGEEDEKPFNSKIRFTNLWLFQQGRWRRAAFHDSRMPN
jgi:ketosteroid isomerase-like protein